MTDRKTPEELGISQASYDTLLTAREILAAPELPKGFIFDMRDFVEILYDDNPHDDGVHVCGTACCIGGTMQLVMSGLCKPGLDLTDEHTANKVENTWLPSDENFGDLFYPDGISNWAAIKASDGVVAIDQFLSGNIRDPWAVYRGSAKKVVPPEDQFLPV